MRSTRCHYCGGTPVDPIPRGALTVDGVAVEACRPCWEAADDEDERRMFMAMALPRFAPEELVPAIWPSSRQRPVRDLLGRRFGRLLVIASTTVPNSDGVPRAAWMVRCDCGREVVMRAYTLERGASRCQICARSALKPRPKLTRSEVEEMRRARARGWTLGQLARQAGVSKTAVQKIVRRETWRDAA